MRNAPIVTHNDLKLKPGESYLLTAKVIGVLLKLTIANGFQKLNYFEFKSLPLMHLMGSFDKPREPTNTCNFSDKTCNSSVRVP